MKDALEAPHPVNASTRYMVEIKGTKVTPNGASYDPDTNILTLEFTGFNVDFVKLAVKGHLTVEEAAAQNGGTPPEPTGADQIAFLEAAAGTMQAAIAGLHARVAKLEAAS